MKCEGKAKQKLIEIRARRISHHFLFSDMAEALFFACYTPKNNLNVHFTWELTFFALLLLFR